MDGRSETGTRAQASGPTSNLVGFGFAPTCAGIQQARTVYKRVHLARSGTFGERGNVWREDGTFGEREGRLARAGTFGERR